MHTSTSRIIRTSRRHWLFFVATLFLLNTFYGAAAADVIAKDPPAAQAPGKEEVIEFVKIDGRKYQVPPPWAGQRIDVPVLTFKSFKKIPVQYTLNKSSIYVLAEAQPHLVAMLSKAEQDGVEIRTESGYRSENYQRDIFKRMLDKGRTFEDIIRYVAPPGYSNHMLGMAVDFYPSNWRFASTPQYAWLRENAHLFGFEETYSQYNRYKMPWEAWHWGYAGSEDKH